MTIDANLSLSYEKIAHAIRKLTESNISITYLNKLEIDSDEYVFNRENDLISLLELIHKLFDECKNKRDFFSIPEIMAVIELRNCFHHNHIKSLDIFHKFSGLIENRYFLLDSFDKNDYLYDRVRTFKAYISWNDFKKHLISSKNNYKHKSKTIDSILNYLNIEKFEKELIDNNLSNNIFIDAMPIIKNGLIKLEKHIGGLIQTSSLEGRLYKDLNSSFNIESFKSLYVADYSFNKDMIVFEFEKRLLSDYILDDTIFILYNNGEPIKFPLTLLDEVSLFFKNSFLQDFNKYFYESYK